MQKKLVALAVASLAWAPFAAQAANVEINGVMDLGLQNSSSQAAGVDTKKTTVGIHNGSSTSSVKFTITEDLGGGMKVKGYIETDPPFGTSTGAALSNAPNWLQISGGFGAITLGYMNNYALSASSASQPYGTGLASGYNGGWARLDGVNVLGTATFTAAGGSGVRDIRINNSVQYELPKMGAFSGGIIYKFKNGDAGNGAQDRIGQVQIGGAFGVGPLNIAFAHSTIENEVVFAGTSDSLTHTMIGANYKLGAITLYGGYTMSQADNKADTDSTSMNFAATFQVSPMLRLGVNLVKVDDKRAADADRDLVGFGLDYALSKRTNAYVRYQSGDKNKADGANGDYSDLGVGISHSF